MLYTQIMVLSRMSGDWSCRSTNQFQQCSNFLPVIRMECGIVYLRYVGELLCFKIAHISDRGWTGFVLRRKTRPQNPLCSQVMVNNGGDIDFEGRAAEVFYAGVFTCVKSASTALYNCTGIPFTSSTPLQSRQLGAQHFNYTFHIAVKR